MLPNSWDDVFYLMKKEVQNHPELPNFTIPQLKKIHNLFWKNLKTAMKDETSEISLNGFMRIVPKLKKIQKYEESKQVLNNGRSESVPQIGKPDKDFGEE